MDFNNENLYKDNNIMNDELSIPSLYYKINYLNEELFYDSNHDEATIQKIIRLKNLIGEIYVETRK